MTATERTALEHKLGLLFERFLDSKRDDVIEQVVRLYSSASKRLDEFDDVDKGELLIAKAARFLSLVDPE